MKIKFSQKIRRKLLCPICLVFVSVFVFNCAPTSVVNAALLRNLTITVMRDMQTIPWVANGNVIVGGNTYKSKILYRGLPYTQADCANDSRGQFISRAETSKYTGTISLPGETIYYFRQPSEDVGNDCSCAVAIAWRAGGSSVDQIKTNTTTFENGAQGTETAIVKVGSYNAVGDTSQMTPAISSSSSQTDKTKHANVITAYGKLQPGDACVYVYPGNTHVILITTVSSTSITYIGQTGPGSTRLSDLHTTWCTGTLSFDSLYASHYVPVKANI